MRSRVQPAGCLCELPGSGEPNLHLFEPTCACPGVRRAGGGCVIFGARHDLPCVEYRRAVPVCGGLTSAIYGGRHRFTPGVRSMEMYYMCPEVIICKGGAIVSMLYLLEISLCLYTYRTS